MALQHSISEASTMRIDTDPLGNPVLDIEFRFVRYRLVLNDLDKTKKLQELINLILDADLKKDEVKITKPKFYKEY